MITLERIESSRDLIMLDGFIREALHTCPFVESVDEALTEILSEVEHEDVGLLVCRENGEPVGMTLLRNNTGAFMRGVSVAHLFNRGSAQARRALLAGIYSFSVLRRAPKIWGIDVNQQPRGYERLLRDWKPERRGILYSYLN